MLQCYKLSSITYIETVGYKTIRFMASLNVCTNLTRVR